MPRHLDSFAIELTNGQTVFIKARNFRVTHDGRLVFYSWPWKKEGAYQTGVWVRTMRGVTPADLEGESE
jgi:isocitrate dehydrogenase kinase/phosphatase